MNRKKSCQEKTRSIDGFGTPFHFYFPDGSDTHKSFVGCGYTVFVVIMVFFWATLQLIAMIDFSNPSIMVSVRDSHYDPTFNFKKSDGLMLAAGITDLSYGSEPIEEPSIGELKVYYRSWG